MTERMEDGALIDMVKCFIRDAGGSEEVTAVCQKLLTEQACGSVCLHVSDAEKKVLASSALVSTLPEDARLFVLNCEKNLFYTRRNWKYEESIRTRLRQMAACPADAPFEVPQGGDFATLNAGQRRAVGIMSKCRFSIVTGGPGTGKTYTISRAVQLLQAHGIGRIALAAPTGKAAARLRETMADCGVADAMTLHALLEPHHDLVTFKRGVGNTLPYDWLIVDEASMIDLPLMAKLLSALSPSCRLTLAGDPYQLSSVEPGRVFGDLCMLKDLQACIAELTESTRFQQSGGIFQLSAAIREGQGDRALELLQKDDTEQLLYYPQNDAAALKTHVLHCWEPLRKSASPAEALRALPRCRVLCAMRRGPFGVEKLNGFIRRQLSSECPVPMMVTRNNASVGVSNGDVGIWMPNDPRNLHFSGDHGQVKTIPLILLSDLETSFATTIHKSQGSEFDNVVIVLPPLSETGYGDGGLLTRELFYTAVTRAKDRVILMADRETVKLCCRVQTERCTGL